VLIRRNVIDHNACKATPELVHPLKLKHFKEYTLDHDYNCISVDADTRGIKLDNNNCEILALHLALEKSSNTLQLVSQCLLRDGMVFATNPTRFPKLSIITR